LAPSIAESGQTTVHQLAEVVEYLRALARKISAADAASPQMAAVGIDVSMIGKPQAK
jgi:hypothetical protein